MADWNADAPENLQILQTSRLWPALIMDRNLQTTAVQGIFIALALSGVVLLIATGNWIITGLTVFTIAGVVVSFLGVFVGLLGWTLGIVESISLAVCAGLSVDFAAHLVSAAARS